MTSASAAAEAQIKSEIERLTGNYKPSNKYIRPGLNVAGPSKPSVTPTPTPTAASVPSSTPAASTPTTGSSTFSSPVIPSSKPVSMVGGPIKEVVLGGVAFESSRRVLVRKDLPQSAKPGKVMAKTIPPRRHPYSRKPSHVPPTKSYKVKAPRGRNMTLNNTRRQYPSRKTAGRRKYVDKPCPRFTTTGSCTRGLTCMYQHDPAKIAICWNFLQDNCNKTAETCNLSHEPTPERTPLCVHFLNKGRCTRDKCPFPHVNVGQRTGVCRDFAVLGYCERGLDCDRQHVRECPDFAEKGTCGTAGCKLPHVIRANRNRKVAAATVGSSDAAAGTEDTEAMVTAEDGQLGDEYISLTFKESDSEDESEGSSEEEEEEEEGSEDESGSEESDSDIEQHSHCRVSVSESKLCVYPKPSARRLLTVTARAPLPDTPRCASPMNPGDASSSSSSKPRAATRLLHSVKRTFTPPRKRYPEYDYPRDAMHSTYAESHTTLSAQQFRNPDPASSRPTIEQIAMGLHISRTPHLRPLASSPYAFSQRNSAPHSPSHQHHHSTPIVLPPPPKRSSLKKPSATVTSSSSSPAISPPFSTASGSSSTVTSVSPSSAQSTRPFAAIKFRMARFLPHGRSSSEPSSMASSPLSSPRTSSSDFPKKNVRFRTEQVVDIDVDEH
uniref:C3H1-type domain-containing protein n=1 Tax=Psilocybe cubensis TaxID=181762 RepID=A0A8H7XTA1_PSICU